MKYISLYRKGSTNLMMQGAESTRLCHLSHNRQAPPGSQPLVVILSPQLRSRSWLTLGLRLNCLRLSKFSLPGQLWFCIQFWQLSFCDCLKTEFLPLLQTVSPWVPVPESLLLNTPCPVDTAFLFPDLAGSSSGPYLSPGAGPHYLLAALFLQWRHILGKTHTTISILFDSSWMLYIFFPSHFPSHPAGFFRKT